MKHALPAFRRNPGEKVEPVEAPDHIRRARPLFLGLLTEPDDLPMRRDPFLRPPIREA